MAIRMQGQNQIQGWTNLNSVHELITKQISDAIPTIPNYNEEKLEIPFLIKRESHVLAYPRMGKNFRKSPLTPEIGTRYMMIRCHVTLDSTQKSTFHTEFERSSWMYEDVEYILAHWARDEFRLYRDFHRQTKTGTLKSFEH